MLFFLQIFADQKKLQFQKLLANKLEETNELLFADKYVWNEKDRKDSIILYECPSRFKLGGNCTKVEGLIEVPAEYVIDSHWKADLSLKKEWEPDIIDQIELLQLSDKERIEYRSYSVSPLSPRDFVQ